VSVWREVGVGLAVLGRPPEWVVVAAVWAARLVEVAAAVLDRPPGGVVVVRVSGARLVEVVVVGGCRSRPVEVVGAVSTVVVGAGAEARRPVGVVMAVVRRVDCRWREVGLVEWRLRPVPLGD
jgi:hypothetical protein